MLTMMLKIPTKLPALCGMRINTGRLALAAACLLAWPVATFAQMENLLAGAEVRASSQRADAGPKQVMRGNNKHVP